MLLRLAFASLLVLAGCAHKVVSRELAATPEALASIAQRQSVRLDMGGGRIIGLKAPRDFGYAVCDDMRCVRKDQIRSLTVYDEELDIGGSMSKAATAVVYAVPFAVLGVGLLVDGATSGADQRPRLTEEMAKRFWLDGYKVTGDRVRYTRENPCTRDSEFVRLAFATDAPALAWVAEHRLRLPARCVESAAAFALANRTGMERQAAMEAWALGYARGSYDTARCKAFAARHIVPPAALDIAPRKGDPAFLDIITRTMADPATWQYEADLASVCNQGVAPEEAWPARLARLKRLGPFGADGVPSDVPEQAN